MYSFCLFSHFWYSQISSGRPIFAAKIRGSAPAPHQGLWPWTPRGAAAPRPLLKLARRRFAPPRSKLITWTPHLLLTVYAPETDTKKASKMLPKILSNFAPFFEAPKTPKMLPTSRPRPPKIRQNWPKIGKVSQNTAKSASNCEIRLRTDF